MSQTLSKSDFYVMYNLTIYIEINLNRLTIYNIINNKDFNSFLREFNEEKKTIIFQKTSYFMRNTNLLLKFC